MKQDFNGKKVGIWGFGVTGQSILGFLSQFECQILITDKNKLNGVQQALIDGHKVQFVEYQFLPQFLELCDIIIPSPGVDLKPFSLFNAKFLSELDLFAQLVTRPTIAITGSVGKTSTVHTLTHLLNKLGKKALACGNIGFPLLDAIGQQNKYDYLVLELSSFQLQHNTLFKPDRAAIITLCPNHLDQHADMFEYITAKGQLFKHQTENQHAIIPIHLMDCMFDFVNKQQVQWLTDDYEVDKIKALSDILPPINAQIIIALLESIDLPTDNLKELCVDLPALPHRIEYVTTINGVDYYNDSKSTIGAATVAAVQKFAGKPIILFLGGLSKGADRSELIKELKNKVNHIICFGAEAQQLHQFCITVGISASHHATLEAAINYTKTITQSGDIVLFSPAGSSFDLFSNYIERGNCFKKLFLIE